MTPEAGQATIVDAQFDVTFSRPCRCPEHHAVTGTCPNTSETVTTLGGMCRPCYYAYAVIDWLGDQPLYEASMPVNRPLR